MAGDKVIAVDLGGTNLRVGLVENNRILKYRKEDTPKTQKALVSLMFRLIEETIEKGVKGIGVSSAGPLKDGIIKNPPNLPLRNFNLKKALKKRFKTRVEVENDANCVALAELKLGAGRGKKNFIVLTLGTGIGGGIVIDGKLYTGEGYGGELGHIILDNGIDFENLAAWKSLKKVTKKEFGREIRTKELMAMNNSKSRKVLKNVIVYLGQGIGSLINIFDPEVVVLAGGIRECSDKLLRMIRQEVEKYSVLPKDTPIIWSRLTHPGTLGASLLVN